MSGEMLNGDADGAKFQNVLCPGLLEASESTSICPLLTPSPSHANLTPSEAVPDPESVSMCPLLESPSADLFRHPLDPLASLAYQQRTPDIDNQPDFIGLVEARDSRSSSLPGNEFGGKRGSSGIGMLGSSSSSSSGLQENPASAQLLSHHYQNLAHENKDGYPAQENGAVCLELTGHKAGADYCFMHWNWPVIRTACFWSVLSITVACFCIVIGMIATVPNKCQPPRAWHQGTVFYEIFPASFQDSNHDGIGDIIGVTSRTEYLKSLGISAIRLNSIFAATHYPQAYQQIHNLTSIDQHLGKIEDIKYMLTTLHSNNISVILDLPIYPLVKSLKETKVVSKADVPKKDIADEITNAVHNHRSHRNVNSENDTQEELARAHVRMLVGDHGERKTMLAPYIDGGISGLMKVTSQHMKSITKTVVEDALEFWFSLGIDGIYVKGLEHYTNDPHFVTELSTWNKIKISHSGSKEKILMADYSVLQLSADAQDAVLNTFDLLDVFLTLSNGTHFAADEISELLKSRSFTEKSFSWLHWNIGNVNTRRLADRVVDSFGAITFQAMLPGTISIFYGDEIGLTDSKDPTGDHQDLQHMYQLTPMQYVNDNTPFTPASIVPWLPLGYAEHSRVTPLVRAVAHLRETVPSIYMNKVCKDGGVLLNSALGFVDDSMIILVRSYPRRHTYAVFYNTDVKDVVYDLTHIYYGGEKVLDSAKASSEETYLKFKNLTLAAGMAFIVKLDK